MTTDHQSLLDPAALEALSTQPIEEVRARRAECVEVETGLSYLRRLVQGSLDIAERELANRNGASAPTTEDLVDELPDILGDAPRPEGMGRLATTLEPTNVDTELNAEYEELVGDGRLARVVELDTTDLEQLSAALRDLEVRISERRRQYHDHIDALQGELTRRYQTGEASVDTLLRDA